jgi:hypothetical protein
MHYDSEFIVRFSSKVAYVLPLRPLLRAAIRVEPDPAKGSSTVPSRGQ